MAYRRSYTVDTTQHSASLTLIGDMLSYQTTYHPKLIEALKQQVPTEDRRWDPVHKVWLVAYKHATLLQTLTARYLLVTISIPPPPAQTTEVEKKAFRLEYLGLCRSRSGAESSAFGWVDGGFNYLFSEKVLREWFKDRSKPGEAKDFYGVLGIDRTANDQDIRKSYRRLAMQYHPDHNKEADAVDQFKLISKAYQTLFDPLLRKKYDFGLVLAAQTTKDVPKPNPQVVDGYRSPLKCGYVMAEGKTQLGRFIVSKILVWADVLREDGYVMVTYWTEGANSPTIKWVSPDSIK